MAPAWPAAATGGNKKRPLRKATLNGGKTGTFD
jgi:hypothetical protein